LSELDEPCLPTKMLREFPSMRVPSLRFIEASCVRAKADSSDSSKINMHYSALQNAFNVQSATLVVYLLVIPEIEGRKEL
jgi:hypothetical protein